MPLVLRFHYTCYVVNMDKKRIQYLDNMPSDDATVGVFFETLVNNFLIVSSFFSFCGGGAPFFIFPSVFWRSVLCSANSYMKTIFVMMPWQ